MFVFKVEVAGDTIAIEVWFGKQRIARHELPIRDIRDRAAVETAFASAESMFRKEVHEWIQSRTQVP